jgi:hypothetical protein
MKRQTELKEELVSKIERVENQWLKMRIKNSLSSLENVISNSSVDNLGCNYIPSIRTDYFEGQLFSNIEKIDNQMLRIQVKNAANSYKNSYARS